MTEWSVRRAAAARNEIEPEAVDYRQLLSRDESVEAALLLLSAHELRSDGARRALLAEVARVLTRAGWRLSPNTCAIGRTSLRSARASCTFIRGERGHGASSAARRGVRVLHHALHPHFVLQEARDSQALIRCSFTCASSGS